MMISGGGSGMVGWSESPEYEAKRKDIQREGGYSMEAERQKKERERSSEEGGKRGGKARRAKLLSSLFIANGVPPILQSDWSDLTAYGTA